METTTTLDPKTIDNIQDLIRVNIDSAKGFDTAAENIDNPEIAGYFRECSRTRRRFADDLSRFVSINDEEPEHDGSAAGRLHRWWLELRGVVQGGDEHAILAEAERGEDAIKRVYERVIVDIAGNPLSDVLHAQFRSVKQTHDRVRDMRDARS